MGAVAAGGALGALARYEVSEALVRDAVGWPWATLLVNAVGCFAIGVIGTMLTAARRPHRLLTPFLTVGVLGGFTTFSAYAVETVLLTREGAPVTALVYLVVTPAVAMLTVLAGAAVGHRLVRGTRGTRGGPQ